MLIPLLQQKSLWFGNFLFGLWFEIFFSKTYILVTPTVRKVAKLSIHHTKLKCDERIQKNKSHTSVRTSPLSFAQFSFSHTYVNINIHVSHRRTHIHCTYSHDMLGGYVGRNEFTYYSFFSIYCVLAMTTDNPNFVFILPKKIISSTIGGFQPNTIM